MSAPTPRDIIGQVRRVDDPSISPPGPYLGTCFAYGHEDVFLTAAHCIGDRKPDEVAVHGYFDGIAQTRRVLEVWTHDNADLAVMRCAKMFWGMVTPFSAIRRYDSTLFGEPFYAYGFPEDVFGPDASRPVPRIFRGYFQRFFGYDSSVVPGRMYQAGEMSIACPSGLSGGPVFTTEGDVEVFGLVTENLESSSYVYEETVEEGEGRITRHKFRKVINYGVCLLLDPHRPWIDSLVRRAASLADADGDVETAD